MANPRSRLLSQQIFERLETDIVDRIHPPGAHLVEDSIAAELGVSRTPVREAFRMLQRAGWLEFHPHSGAYVRHPTMDEVREVFELRQSLEEKATRLAAERITEAQRKELAKLIERGWRAVARSDVKALASLNSAFHATIAEAARNQILKRILDDLGKQVRWHFSAVAAVRGEASWTEHEEILEAIDRGEAERAGELAVAHSHRTQETFFARFLSGGVVDPARVVALDGGGTAAPR
ncbi:MAG: GntR family transcriptional regulator [Actinomycetota bacterium]